MIEFKRRVDVAQVPKILRALSVLGATQVKLAAYGWWRCTKDGESMDLYPGHEVLARRGSRIKVRVSTPDGAEDVWATPESTLADPRLSGRLEVSAFL